ncbi:hypothetical hydrolase [Mycobacterium tuberculosis GM 1503]|nr:hypothetical hydrolase [Mycobacterium tuberculosis GM 1503]
MTSPSVREWRDGGRWLPTAVGKVFVRSGPGDTPTMLLLHGYPSSSFDFRAVIPHLTGQAWVTMDFLGFGLSDKPRPHRYSLLEQAHLVETVVAHTVTGAVVVLAHDMGTSVTTELLARDLDGRVAVRSPTCGAEQRQCDLGAGQPASDPESTAQPGLVRSLPGWSAAVASHEGLAGSSPQRTRCRRRRPKPSGSCCATTTATGSRTC